MKRRARHNRHAPCLSVRTLIGNDVYNLETDELGAIQDIVMDPHTGHISFAVLRCNTDPLTGEKLVAVPWYKLTLDKQMHCFLLDLSIERLRSAPALDVSHWPALTGTVWQQAGPATPDGHRL